MIQTRGYFDISYFRPWFKLVHSFDMRFSPYYDWNLRNISTVLPWKDFSTIDLYITKQMKRTWLYFEYKILRSSFLFYNRVNPWEKYHSSRRFFFSIMSRQLFSMQSKTDCGWKKNHSCMPKVWRFRPLFRFDSTRVFSFHYETY